MVGLFTTAFGLLKAQANDAEASEQAFGNIDIKACSDVKRSASRLTDFPQNTQFSFTINTNLFKSKQQLDTLMSYSSFYFK